MVVVPTPTELTIQTEEALCEVSTDHQSVEAADGVKHLSVEFRILGGALFLSTQQNYHGFVTVRGKTFSFVSYNYWPQIL